MLQSVLAGLAPNIAMEIATRSISFWTYQKSQEATFQAMVLKNAQERNAVLEKRLQTMSVESASEMSLLHEKIAGLEKELALEKRKTKELQDSLRTATKDYDRLKNQLDRSMRKQMLSAGEPGDALAAAAQQPGNLAQREAINQSLASQPRASLGGTQKPAPFWHSQASAQSHGHEVPATPARPGEANGLSLGMGGLGSSQHITPNANHGRFVVNAGGGAGGGSGAHANARGAHMRGLGHAHAHGDDHGGRQDVDHSGLNTRPSGARMGISPDVGQRPGQQLHQTRLVGASNRGNLPNFASPIASSGWVQPRPVSQNFVRPIPSHPVGTRIATTADGVNHEQRNAALHARGVGVGGGALDPLRTPRGPSPIGQFLRSAVPRSGGQGQYAMPR